MASRTSIYYSAPFKGYLGVTQVDPISPKLFNIMSYAIISYWLKIVAEEAAGLEEFDHAVHWMASFFYVDDGPIA